MYIIYIYVFRDKSLSTQSKQQVASDRAQLLQYSRFHRSMFPKPKSQSSKGGILKSLWLCVCVRRLSATFSEVWLQCLSHSQSKSLSRESRADTGFADSSFDAVFFLRRLTWEHTSILRVRNRRWNVQQASPGPRLLQMPTRQNVAVPLMIFRSQPVALSRGLGSVLDSKTFCLSNTVQATTLSANIGSWTISALKYIRIPEDP